MTLEVKRAYLRELRLRYKNATKRQKGVILSEFCATSGLSRKHVIRLLNMPAKKPELKPGPKAKYGTKVVRNLARLWRVMNMCSVRMKQALPIWLRYDENPDLDAETRTLLTEMSSSTIDRLLRPFRKRRGLSSTESSAFIKSKIPIELLTSAVKAPGTVEADTVAHCGNSLSGKFGNTLTVTDLYSGWTENYATLTKSAKEVISGIKNIRYRAPFSIKEFACDNGSEFLNHDLVNYFQNKNYGYVKVVRRRPYKKNDNAHVEQKNDTHVRKLFGYSRIEHPDLIEMMNDIYRWYWNPLLNHFYPAMKLKNKVRIGGKLKKTYDTPKTPYQRLLDSGSLSEKQTKNLQESNIKMNPFTLEKLLNEKICDFKMALAQHASLIEMQEDKMAS